ncbi:MAG: SIMPL domain-containing protein [Thermosynechococcaceae cyanobacterium]
MKATWMAKGWMGSALAATVGLTSAGLAPVAAQPNAPAIAQLFYPPAADPNSVVRVIGKGRANRPADLADLSFEFSLPDRSPDSSEPTALRFQSASDGISETTLVPILKALTAVGVAKTQIQVRFKDGTATASPFPFPLPSQGSDADATIAVRQPKPTQAGLAKIVTAVQKAAGSLSEVSISRVAVNYSIQDCQPLEADVYQAAARDAKNRAMAIASALGGKLNPAPSVAQPFYDLFLPSCGKGLTLPFLDSVTDYSPETPPEVSLSREIFVTYTLTP